MRLLIAAQSYRPPLNGEAVFSIRLAEGLAAAGHSVAVATPSGDLWPQRAVQNGVEVHGFVAFSLAPWHPEVRLTPLPRLGTGSLLEETTPEVVHVQDHYPLCRAVAAAARARSVPLLASNYFVPGNMIPQLPGFLRWRRDWVERVLWRTVLSVLNRADLVTTPTESAAALLQQKALHVPVRAISCGVDLERFRPDLPVDRSALRRRYGLDPDRTLYLYVGRVDRDKGLDVLLEALSALDRDDVQLGIAGRGSALRALQAQARRLDLGRRVAFAGYVTDDDLPALLNSADIFCMPSVVELQSIATLEAMGTGRPVLAADAQALPELVHDGVNGYLFRPDDPQDAARVMAELADHPESWSAMGAASLDLVRPHRFEHTLRQFGAVYRSLC